MKTAAAAAGSVLFLLIAPGLIAGYIPWLITHWIIPDEAPVWSRVGVVIIAAGAIALLFCFSRFAFEGRGTPAPVAPTEHLVIGGLYRYVRNPMYIAVLSIILGQALFFWCSSLVIYAIAGGTAMVLFVRFYEEPVLSRRYGAEYDAYRRAVPGWWPRLRPWRP